MIFLAIFLTLWSLKYDFYFFFSTRDLELAIKRKLLMHPSSSSDDTTCGKTADRAGGARTAAYTAQG